MMSGIYFKTFPGLGMGGSVREAMNSISGYLWACWVFTISKVHPLELKKIYGQEDITEIKWWWTCPRSLWGFDSFMNHAIYACVEMAIGGWQNKTGMAVIWENCLIVFRNPGMSINRDCVHQRNQLLPHVPSLKGWIYYHIKIKQCIFP